MVLADGEDGMISLAIILDSLPFTSIGAVSPSECGDGVPIRVCVESTRSLVETTASMAFVGSRGRIIVILVVVLSANSLLMGTGLTVVLAAFVGICLIPILVIVTIVGLSLRLQTCLVVTIGLRCIWSTRGGNRTSYGVENVQTEDNFVSSLSHDGCK